MTKAMKEMIEKYHPIYYGPFSNCQLNDARIFNWRINGSIYSFDENEIEGFLVERQHDSSLHSILYIRRVEKILNGKRVYAYPVYYGGSLAGWVVIKNDPFLHYPYKRISEIG